MRGILKIIALSLWALNAGAEEEEDIFADIDLEIDKNYQDDFDDIEKKPRFTNSQETSSLVAHSYNNFSQRSWARDEQSLGLLLSQETIARSFYMTLFPQVRFNVWEIHSHLGLPLRFPLYDNVAITSMGARKRGFVDIEKFISPREADYRSFADAFKLVRQCELGGLNKSYYIGLVREQALSLGHGDMMREMSTDYLYDQDYLFARGHINFDPIRIEAMTGPIPKINMLGLHAQIKPLSAFGPAVENMSFDLGYVADYAAPGEIKREEDSFVLDSEKRLIKHELTTAQAITSGIASLYEPISWFNSKPYLTFGQLWLTGLKDKSRRWSYGLAFNIGHDAIFTLTPDKRSQIFFRSEARFFSDNYMPNYFGGNYMLDRISLFESSNNPITKAQFASATNDKNWRFGHMFELGYAYDKIFNTKLAYENARILSSNTPIKPLRKLNFTTNLVLFERLHVRAAYEANALDTLKELFDLYKSRSLISLQGQVKILSFLYFDSWLKHSFGVENIYESSNSKTWLSHKAETRSLNYGLGLELAMTF